MHENGKPEQKCEQCGKGFLRKSHLLQHNLRQHVKENLHNSDRSSIVFTKVEKMLHHKTHFPMIKSVEC